MTRALWTSLVVVGVFTATIAAQWGKFPDPTVPRNAQGQVRMDAPTPRRADGKPDLSGLWMRAESGPPRQGGPGRGTGANGGNTNSAFAPGRGGVQLEPPTERFPFDPSGPPVATFFEAGANMEGGLPYTPWAAELRKQRLALNARDNPDAMCLPMGFLQFHQQPQPRRI
jgi:hypothetical protein